MRKKEHLCLGLDTTSDMTSVACLSDTGEYACLQESCARGQGEILMDLIQQVLEQMRKVPPDLSCIAVAVGPGSFTGVCIGLSVARGLGLALKIPVRGVDNFLATAYDLKRPVKIVLDSKRTDFFVQDFSKKNLAISEPRIQTVVQLRQAMPFVACGSGAERLAEQIDCDLIAPNQPLALAMSRIALFDAKKTIGAHPLYLRDADVTL